jgi:hypothetical protein
MGATTSKPTGEKNSMSDWEPWKREMAGLTVLYRLAIVKQDIPIATTDTDFAFIEPLLDEMYRKGLIDQQQSIRWAVTEKGAAVIRAAIQMYDHLLKFEIFAKVDLGRPLGNDEANPDSPNQVFDNLYDPRFGDPQVPDQPGAWEDLRLAVMTFLQETSQETGGDRGTLDLHRIVFVQKLAAGQLWSPSFWFDLRVGTVFEEIDMIAETAVKWREVAEAEQDAASAMRTLYTAGMVEQRKRDGRECSTCGTPLAIYQTLANGAGRMLESCPNPACGASFGSPPSPGGLACPLCHADLDPTQRICSCGAHLDYALPPGTIREACVTDTVEEVVPAWGTYYDPRFVPYGYYDPWAWSATDALAFGVVCALLW